MKDDRLDIAISTAGAGNLDKIVVLSSENAKGCIKFLRDNKIGSASFIILDNIQYLQ